jgi:hypothetical protein
MKRAASILIVALACEPSATTAPPTSTAPPPTSTAPPPASTAPPPTSDAAKCPAGNASPLVLQLGAVKASAIERALHLGIAVVAFDCNELVPLDSCSIDGRYDFVPRPRVDVDRRIASRAEAASPLWGKSTPPLRIEPGEVLTLKLVTLGQERATVSSAARKDLRGRCEGATHFVRAVDVGAFELTGVRGTKTTELRAGRLQECPTSAGVLATECRAPLQLELVPIGP